MNSISRKQFLMGAAAFTSGCAALNQTGSSKKWVGERPVEKAFVNARIWTGQSTQPYSDAIGVTGGKITVLGRDAVDALSSPKTQSVDLEGAFVPPGLIDSHVHFSMASLLLGQPSLRSAGTKDDFIQMISNAANQMQGQQWLQGGYWDNDAWGGEMPHRDWIDAVTSNIPVAVVRYDLHMVLLNSYAMAILGIHEDIAHIEGGIIERDTKGRLTGIFKDEAKEYVVGLIPQPTDQVVDAANKRGMNLAVSKGITQVYETGIDWQSFHSTRRMRNSGDMLLRFYSMVPLKDWEVLAAIIRDEGYGDDWVRWGGCKALMDGSLGSRTALFENPYLDDPSTSGILTNDPDNLFEMMQGADAAGLQLAIHAIGDRANNIVLDLMKQLVSVNGARDRRMRIEHAQHLQTEAILRFVDQDIIASMQPYHAIDDGRWAVNRIGPQRLNGTYAFHSLVDVGTHVAFGSDWPVAPLDPLEGIHAAVLRQTLDGKNPDGWYPEQRVNVETALKGYTYEAAYAGNCEQKMGTLAPDFSADFVVWDQDITRINPEKIRDTNVLRTIIAGRQVFTL